MNVKITIDNDENREVINVYSIRDLRCFSYEDSYGASCIMNIYDDGITIDRKIDDHSTLVSLREPCHIEIVNEIGKLEFDVKRLAFEVNDGNIFIAYTVNDLKTVIKIEYFVGGNN